MKAQESENILMFPAKSKIAPSTDDRYLVSDEEIEQVLSNVPSEKLEYEGWPCDYNSFDEEKDKTVETQLEDLRETMGRIRYYLDEMKSYLPKKRRR